MAGKIRTLKNLYLNNPAPNHVTINLTNKCNHRCIYCEIGQGLIKTEKPLISLDEVKWVIDEMKTLGINFLALSGGEPFLFKDIFEIIQYAYKSGIHCTIMTNGMNLSDLSDNKLNILNKCNSRITISIDSFNNKTEGFIRGVNNALPKQINGIKKLIRKGIDVGLLTVISAYNFNDIAEVVIKGDELGVSSVSFQPVIFISNYSEVTPIPNKFRLNIKTENLQEIDKQFSQIMEYQRIHPVKTNIFVLREWLKQYILYLNNPKGQYPFFSLFIKRFFCAPLYRDITINYYGDILPCNMLKPGKSIKQKNGQSLLNLWNETCEKMRYRIQSKKLPRECKSCVCAFDKNLTFSILKYPISNFNFITKYFIRGMINRLING